MEELIAEFPSQLARAIELGQKNPISNGSSEIQNVVITGLGGSGIGGKLVQSLSHACVPIEVINDYDLPDYASKKTLILVSSYSGNTEETVSAMKQAIDRGCQIVAVTSGGEVKELCEKNNLQFIEIPGGNPPRSQLAYSLVQQFFVLHAYNLIGDYTAALQGAASLLENKQEEIKVAARNLAAKLKGKMPVLYCSSNIEPVAIRWRQQLNENSKALCWHHVLPEMNHNELVGWELLPEDVALVLLRTNTEHPRTKARFSICESIFAKASSADEFWAEGESAIEQVFYLIHLGDWASLYLAYENEVDPMDIKNIDYLKNALTEL